MQASVITLFKKVFSDFFFSFSSLGIRMYKIYGSMYEEINEELNMMHDDYDL